MMSVVEFNLNRAKDPQTLGTNIRLNSSEKARGRNVWSYWFPNNEIFLPFFLFSFFPVFEKTKLEYNGVLRH